MVKLRVAIFLTTLLLFGFVTGVVALVFLSLGVTGITAWLLASLILLFLQWFLSPSIILAVTRAREVKEGWIVDAVKELAQRAGIPAPKVYIVEDPTPNAFAFGRWKSDGRIAIHRGLLETLDREEVKGVIAHELGHIAHGDMVVMTLAQAVPILLYYLVLFFGSDEERNPLLVLLGAYAAQFLGQLLALFISRLREYYADEFSAKLLSPYPLISALIKISYFPAPSRVLAPMYFADPSPGDRRFAELASRVGMDPKRLKELIEQEKERRALELFSTHPLTYKRIAHLLELS